MPETNYFTDLLAVECSTDRKGKLTYVSWIEAWSQLKQRHPGATYEVHRTETGAFLHGEGFVMCSVTVPGADASGEAMRDVTHTMWLPVMDFKNAAVPNPDTTQINKALMRCLAKCVAMHGLGAYVYMGEDLPTVEASGDGQTGAPPEAKREEAVDYGAKLADLQEWAQAPRSEADVSRAMRSVASWPDREQAAAVRALNAIEPPEAA